MLSDNILDDLRKIISDAAFYGSLGDVESVNELKETLCAYVTAIAALIHNEGQIAAVIDMTIAEAIDEHRRMNNGLFTKEQDN